ncbi:methyltransferase [Streptomyces sp. NBC_01217]|uniref:methyltransferase n=1 Tax=Streptomyces sp. NBC_01217 TaxID=2903779 RepID=UPI002E109954|nr:methyltransferase [Streptomyces sp. NBC_01217]
MTTTAQTSLPPTARQPLDMDGLAWILFGHAAFQYLNAAVETELLDELVKTPGVTKEELAERLSLQERAIDILLLGTTAMGLTVKENDRYRLADVLKELTATEDWQRFKDTVGFEQYVVYEGQLDFTESLRTNTNVGLRRVRGTGRDLYHRLSENPHMEAVFYRYMRSWSELANRHLVDALDLGDARALLDCGGGDAVNSIALAAANSHLRATVFEIPESSVITQKKIAEAGLAERVDVIAGDMFADPFPGGHDVILFAHQLVIWTLEENTRLLAKAYEALPEGGKLVIFNSMSNDEGDGPVVAALDSVYFAAIPAEGGMIYSWKQHEECLQKAGFGEFERIDVPGWTPHGIIIATK